MKGCLSTNKKPFATWPYFAEDEIDVCSEVLRSGRVNYWTGDEGRFFEKEFAAFIGTRYALSLANGTVALELALYSYGIGPGDEVIVPCRTFIASASCVVMRGAHPVMADVDPESQNITAETIRPHITPRTKAIIVVHLSGWPCDMDPIIELAKKYNLIVIEDCAQAHGAVYKGRKVGSIGHAAAFSFCQDKIVTTGGEGGMLVTNDPTAWERAWSYKDHGKNYNSVYAGQKANGFRWVHDSFGTNFRMTEMQAAIGRVQLRKLPAWLIKRKANAMKLAECFSEIAALRVPLPTSDIEHAYYKFYAFINKKMLKLGWDRDKIINEINLNGVPCYSGSCSEIYLEKAFDVDIRPKRRFDSAKKLGETSLMFLVHPTLTDADMAYTCEIVKKVFLKASV
ncbi:MAG: DegT/DnrJ/EryC1/StrS aminotransferase family protein [Dissulfurispiraceae bacterium]|jgi:dTDP-4-amino-4,6-dideoxygalactose transaminase|nr:DegT/DnrJ/EryC1/StrS aminotransferase family protein [Dissulfurispiraceae bacterium]